MSLFEDLQERLAQRRVIVVAGAGVSIAASGDGVNETQAVTDDPGAGGVDDPTTFQVPAATDIPTLETAGPAILALLLAGGASIVLRRSAAEARL